MLFNSIEFIIFLPVVFAAYWCAARHLRIQNALVVVSSYVFYGWWDWRFLTLIAFTSAWSFVAGRLEASRMERKLPGSKVILTVSLLVNLGILGFFKYFNFFAETLIDVLGSIGLHVDIITVRIILPVGVSFYTFQALSYTIDVYRRQIAPTKDAVAFFAFISFFPQLVAGPIERATNLLPQFLVERRFDHGEAVMGCRQMLWGFFKKTVIADTCAVIANGVFNDWMACGGGALVVGALAFTLQIYGDFSGYSDIAIGCGKLFGIRLMQNFDHPYFSRSIAEFWRRWHISLTTWFRDYLYIPLGGSRCGKARQIRNTFAIFLVSGLWHGANWTFVMWGFYHACCFLPLMLLKTNRKYATEVVGGNRFLPGFRNGGRIIFTFCMVVFGWLIFRSPNLHTLWGWLGRICGSFQRGYFYGIPHSVSWTDTLVLIPLFIVVEWLTRAWQHPLEHMPKAKCIRWGIYVVLILLIGVFMPPGKETFIYFQF